MKEKLGLEPAFPLKNDVDYDINGIVHEDKHGMSKRFYAACAAMQGMLANSNPNMIYTDREKFIIDCYDYADELLRQEQLNTNENGTNKL